MMSIYIFLSLYILTFIAYILVYNPTIKAVLRILIIFLFIEVGIVSTSKVTYYEMPIYQIARTNDTLTVIYNDNDTFNTVTTKQRSLYMAKDADIAVQAKRSHSIFNKNYINGVTIVHRLDLNIGESAKGKQNE